MQNCKLALWQCMLRPRYSGICGAVARAGNRVGLASMLPSLDTHRIPLFWPMLKYLFSGLKTRFYPWEHLPSCQVWKRHFLYLPSGSI